MENNQNKSVNAANVYTDYVGLNKTKAAKKVTFNTASARDYVTSEAFKTLRTNLFFSGGGMKTILITSCLENEGKSTVATELAKSVAESGKRTLLIDADMRKSVMIKKRGSHSLGIVGLSEILSGMCNLEDALYQTQLENFDVIFSGPFPPNPVELIEIGKFDKLLERLKETYDYIIIDSPPLGQVIDAAVIGSFCDAAILVISGRRISRKLALDVKDQLQKSGCKILGTVLNENEKRSSYTRSKYYGKYNYK
ncbi:MAG: CpsD/CapB family tyrosine-protein kinase [Oscillospiraceae bacterium]|nr:CpsD/CapB family tyrosine-protein kinase [Oscillospiraceae bacterium]